ncbi:MAG: hypothetical protein ACRBDI_09785 [Alphaproteobacteria bacterium]
MALDFVLPWWAWAYLFALLSLFFAGLFSGEERSFNRIISSAFSVFSINIFVIGFFNGFIIDLIGYLIIPMFMIGVFWEFTRANIETARAQSELEKEVELSEGERDFLLNTALLFNAVVIVPGYVAGFVLCLRVLGLM